MASQAARDNREEGVCGAVGRGGESVCVHASGEGLYREGDVSREDDETWFDK